MKVSKSLKGYLLAELRYASKRMKEEQDPRRKLFFFSSVFGSTNRALNMEFDEDLLFVDFLAQQCYNTISPRVDQVYLGGDSVVPIARGLMDALTSLVGKLANAIEEDKGLEAVLKDLVILAYSTTGNGAYLFERGKIKLPVA